jgi:hypothetical protein
MNTNRLFRSARLLLCLSLAMPAAAQTGEGAGEGEIANPDKMQCKNIRELNSRIPVRICRTRAEWAQLQKESQEAMRKAQSGGYRCGESASC